LLAKPVSDEKGIQTDTLKFICEERGTQTDADEHGSIITEKESLMPESNIQEDRNKEETHEL
jgi:hypothetical protein